MTTSPARVMVRVSSHPAASIDIVVFVGMCTTAAPSLGCPLMSEPSVYTHYFGEKWGIQGIGIGGVSVAVAVGWECVFPIPGSVRVSPREGGGAERMRSWAPSGCPGSPLGG